MQKAGSLVVPRLYKEPTDFIHSKHDISTQLKSAVKCNNYSVVPYSVVPYSGVPGFTGSRHFPTKMANRPNSHLLGHESHKLSIVS